MGVCSTTARCALVGQALGTLAGDTLFLKLESAGVMTLSGQWSAKLTAVCCHDRQRALIPNTHRRRNSTRRQLRQRRRRVLDFNGENIL